MSNSRGFAGLTPLQLGLLAGGAVIFVLLLLADRTALEEQGGMARESTAEDTGAAGAPKRAPASPPGGKPSTQSAAPTETVELALTPPLPEAAQTEAERLRKAIDEEASSPQQVRSLRQELATLFEENGQPALAADALAPLADTTQADSLARRIGAMYAAACERLPARDAPKRFAVLNARSAAYYRAYLDNHPDDLHAKVQLALRLTNQTPPMKGVLMLRRLAEENPKLFEAQLQLGRLSVRSNQWEKAEERFRNALAIRPKSAETHFLLAQVLLNSPAGDRAEAKTLLQQAESLAGNAELRRAIDRLKARAFQQD